MATPKMWTADDVLQGKLTIHRVDHPDTGQPALQVEQRYVFVDGQGAVLSSIAGGRVLATVEIADLPQEVVSALQTIDTWTYQQALAQEGME
jgi:hypothetical protein